MSIPAQDLNVLTDPTAAAAMAAAAAAQVGGGLAPGMEDIFVDGTAGAPNYGGEGGPDGRAAADAAGSVVVGGSGQGAGAGVPADAGAAALGVPGSGGSSSGAAAAGAAGAGPGGATGGAAGAGAASAASGGTGGGAGPDLAAGVLLDDDDDGQRKINLAAASDGASIVAANKEAKRPDRLIDGDDDSYMKNACSASKWVIVELSQLGRVDEIKVRGAGAGAWELGRGHARGCGRYS